MRKSVVLLTTFGLGIGTSFGGWSQEDPNLTSRTSRSTQRSTVAEFKNSIKTRWKTWAGVAAGVAGVAGIGAALVFWRTRKPAEIYISQTDLENIQQRDRSFLLNKDVRLAIFEHPIGSDINEQTQDTLVKSLPKIEEKFEDTLNSLWDNIVPKAGSPTYLHIGRLEGCIAFIQNFLEQHSPQSLKDLKLGWRPLPYHEVWEGAIKLPTGDESVKLSKYQEQGIKLYNNLLGSTNADLSSYMKEMDGFDNAFTEQFKLKYEPKSLKQHQRAIDTLNAIAFYKLGTCYRPEMYWIGEVWEITAAYGKEDKRRTFNDTKAGVRKGFENYFPPLNNKLIKDGEKKVKELLKHKYGELVEPKSETNIAPEKSLVIRFSNFWTVEKHRRYPELHGLKAYELLTQWGLGIHHYNSHLQKQHLARLAYNLQGYAQSIVNKEPISFENFERFIEDMNKSNPYQMVITMNVTEEDLKDSKKKDQSDKVVVIKVKSTLFSEEQIVDKKTSSKSEKIEGAETGSKS